MSLPADLTSLWLMIAALGVAGLLAGYLGGLFGIGGGIILVPVLFHLFGALGVSDAVRAQAAVATSLSTIIATSLRSMRAHRASGMVDDAVLRTWIPWIVAGAAGGALVAGMSDPRLILGVFGAVGLVLAAHMAFGRETWRLAADLPRGWGRRATASALGGLSAVMGIGGGAFGTAIMTLCGRPIHQAVATASGFGAAIAAPATLMFIITGWGVEGLAPLSLGYVNLVGFVVLAALTTLTAPFGARLAHRLDRTVLRRLFALFFAVMATSMLHEALGG
jgi:uncharacterized membrane protein YfcA